MMTHTKTSHVLPMPKRHWLKYYLRVLAWGLVAVLVLALLIASFRARTGHHLSFSDSPVVVPENATDIAYFLPGAFGPNKVYEFTTSEPSFLGWANRWLDMPMRGPSYGRTSVVRYDHELNRWEVREIENGILFRWNEEDRGINLVFDRQSGRAYYHSHSR